MNRTLKATIVLAALARALDVNTEEDTQLDTRALDFEADDGMQVAEAALAAVEARGLHHEDDAVEPGTKMVTLNLADVDTEDLVGTVLRATDPAGAGAAGIGLKHDGSCWKSTTTRGWGKPLDSCTGERWRMQLGLCYRDCRKGYFGAAHLCWTRCPHGFHNDGAYCRKTGGYWRGAGNWRMSYCESHNKGKGSCERWGLLKYPKCKKGFHNFGCCRCIRDCPPH